MSIARAAFLLVFALAACGSDEADQTPIPSHAYGDPLAAGPKPDPGACQQRIRADIAAAVRIRGSLAAQGVAATEGAARAAAADPTSDTTTIGVPVSRAELAALDANGLAFDDASPMSYWVEEGAPDRFGGMWLEGSTLVVTILNGDPAALGLARCLAPADTRFLWADVSQAEGRATQARIDADMAALRAQGLQINMTYYDVKTGLVIVGVSTPTPELQALLNERYGARVLLIEAGPAIPA